MAAISPIPAAQYLRVSTEHQQYSLEFQTATIHTYAIQHNFAVVQTYTDEGRSGLALRHREGFARLLHDIVAGHKLYRVVLVYDISRWGRFQDAYESAYYEFLCKQAGSPIHYCAGAVLERRNHAKRNHEGAQARDGSGVQP
jgi:DNA invertase Pin-like site-specific DNA recombinase